MMALASNNAGAARCPAASRDAVRVSASRATSKLSGSVRSLPLRAQSKRQGGAIAVSSRQQPGAAPATDFMLRSLPQDSLIIPNNGEARIKVGRIWIGWVVVRVVVVKVVGCAPCMHARARAHAPAARANRQKYAAAGRRADTTVRCLPLAYHSYPHRLLSFLLRTPTSIKHRSSASAAAAATRSTA